MEALSQGHLVLRSRPARPTAMGVLTATLAPGHAGGDRMGDTRNTRGVRTAMERNRHRGKARTGHVNWVQGGLERPRRGRKAASS